MKKKRHKVGDLKLSVQGFIAFGKFGDVWMGSHSKDRLMQFIEQQPQLKLEPEIYVVSTKPEDVRIIKPDQLRDRHADAIEGIPGPPAKTRKKRAALLTAHQRKDS